ncbi:MAG: hypothetical protein BGO25_14030 [Acidobacteriales bacterium 59-55]|nr:MAG: hypothetical protein ABT04_00335 [Granulicella sp. SCN 62-9]OJV44304.1 MAG: hypothetical protein BGO25_14030 [Acidobacteriales bacterium 59-55]
MTSHQDALDTKTRRIEEFLRMLIESSGLDLAFRVMGGGGGNAAGSGEVSAEISVEFTGADTPLLTARNAELLHSIEHLAAKALRLEPEQHHLISFDAENFKLLRNAELQMMAEVAVERVRASGRPYSFPPMNSRERRLLHLALSASGLPTASTSDGPRRFVVLYPEGQEPSPQASTSDRSHAIRKTFRRR